MSSRVIPLLVLVAVAAASAAVGPTTAPATAPSLSIWDGIYSSAQVARGEKAYNSTCARCHGDNLMGNDDAPALIEKDFLDKWDGRSVGDLIDLTWKKMPSDGPGKLNRRQSTDVVTYLLSQNGFPTGKSDLVPDADVVNGILIKEKK